MAGKGSFDDRIRELADRVGSGTLTGRVEVNQVYAAVQEFTESYSHPSGGQAHYLESSLFDRSDSTWQNIADDLLERGPTDAMTDGVEAVSALVARRAPVDLSNLRGSAHPTVTDGGETVYDRPPVQARLSDGELAAMRRGRKRG